MVTTMSIRDLTRKSNEIFNYDYVEVENQKSKKYHGLFITPKYAKQMKEILDAKIEEDKKKKLDELNDFIGICRGEIGNKRVGDIKAESGK